MPLNIRPNGLLSARGKDLGASVCDTFGTIKDLVSVPRIRKIG
jgi:hypothetical protein